MIRNIKIRHFVKAADVVFGFLVILPLGVFYFRGSWDIWVHYVNLDCRDFNASAATLSSTVPPSRLRPRLDIPCDDQGGHWVSGLTGCSVMILFNLFSPLMVKYITPERCTWPGFIIISRLYFYVFAFAYMGQWRGVWGLTDHYDGDLGWRQNLLGLAPCFGIGFLFRCSKMATSTPWHCEFDIASGEEFEEHGHSAIFKCFTWFGTTVST